MTDDIVYLLKKGYKPDGIGNQIPVKEERPVFAMIGSVSQAEYFEAGKMGLKPEYKITIYNQEYDGEEKVRYGDTIFSIYRTYLYGDRLEMYLTKKDGVQHG